MQRIGNLADVGAAAEGILLVLADEAERTGDTGPLEVALATGDMLGGRDPVAVAPDVRDAIAQVLTAHLDDDEMLTVHHADGDDGKP
jgi:hypothetical protein